MKSFILRIVLILFAAAGLAGAVAWWYVQRPLPMGAEVVEFTVERGFNMRQAARAIAEAGVDVHPEALYWLARLEGKADRIVAGSYEAHAGITASALIDKLFRGEVALGELLLVEGWTFRQVRAAIESHPHLIGDTAGLSEHEILERIGADAPHPEGLFFPDTYRFDRRSSALALLKSAYDAMQQRLDRAWQQRDPALPLGSPYEALILASIIEKETSRDDERELVASVFANRLRVGMRLQTDPTVIYGFGDDFAGRLRRHHLQTDHEYNTYTRAGLPPTPISMPGWDSLLAAVRPAQSEYYYFVARGDGSSHFSRNLNEHNRAVNKYQRGRGG
ncbi:MAG TPA: endolytic transglycosylase MltG [Rhodocyclaceae bacterium]|nr:endolytic transglycosylase MltG [Rhodocyclaceae bacterium]